MFGCYHAHSMDAQTPLFTKPRGRNPRRLALASAAAGLAFALTGCDTQRVGALEERVTAVEAKAEAADKRAKAAEALAIQTPDISQPDPAPASDLEENSDDGASSPDEGSGPGDPPPMADNGKG